MSTAVGSAGTAELALHTQAGALVLSLGNTHLPVAFSIESDDGTTFPAKQWQARGSSLAGRCDGFAVECALAASRGGLKVAITVTRTAAGPTALRTARLAIAPTSLWSAEATPSALRLGWCGAFSRSEESRSFVAPVAADTVVSGWWVGAMSAGRGVVLGAVDFRRFVTSVDHRRNAISAQQYLERWPLARGESLALAPMWMAVTDRAPLEALESYAAEVASVHGASPPPPACGWGTWGHFLDEIDAGLLRETVATLDGIAGVGPAVRVVQIDDGWSEMLASGKASASWRPNRRFPSGIAPLSAEITSTGRDCGLWMLPFTVNHGSSLAAEHPEFLVRGANGAPSPVGSGSFCIDPTHAGAAEWLGDLFRDVRDWGVRYVKLDFLRGLLAAEPLHKDDGLASPRRYASARTRVEAYRRGLEVIRSAMGKDAYLLGCSAPTGPGAGLVSAHRVGPDIEPEWVGKLSGVRDAARAVAANWFWNRRTWVNDPDYVVPCETEDLTRFWAAIVAMSGGAMVLSADLSEMDPWIEELFAFIAPPIGVAARPLDLFENGPEPRCWQLPLSKDGHDWQVVAMFNWSDQPRALPLDLGRLGLADEPVHVWDAWRRRHRIAKGAASVFVEPHGVVLLRLTPKTDEPTVIGTDIHFGQGFFEIESQRWNSRSRALTIEGALRAGSAYVWSTRAPSPAENGRGAFGANVHRVALVPGRRTTTLFAS